MGRHHSVAVQCRAGSLESVCSASRVRLRAAVLLMASPDADRVELSTLPASFPPVSASCTGRQRTSSPLRPINLSSSCATSVLTTPSLATGVIQQNSSFSFHSKFESPFIRCFVGLPLKVWFDSYLSINCLLLRGRRVQESQFSDILLKKNILGKNNKSLLRQVSEHLLFCLIFCVLKQSPLIAMCCVPSAGHLSACETPTARTGDNASYNVGYDPH